MAEGKRTFVFYSDWINMVRELDDEDAGGLLKHILAYVNDENPSTDNKIVKVVFAHMKPILKADLQKWEGIREIRQKLGRKGGKAKAKQKLAKAKQLEAVNVNVSTNVDDYPAADHSLNIKHMMQIVNNKTEHQTWIETAYRKYKLKSMNLGKALEEFNDTLVMTAKIHPTLKDYKHHFFNWMNTQQANNRLSELQIR